jgi:hypothetical protein
MVKKYDEFSARLLLIAPVRGVSCMLHPIYAWLSNESICTVIRDCRYRKVHAMLTEN